VSLRNSKEGRTNQLPPAPPVPKKHRPRAWIWATVAAVLVGLWILGTVSQEDDAPAGTSQAETVEPVADTSEEVCTRFREIAAGAFGESMSFAQIVDGLEEVGELGTTAADPSISTLAVQVGQEHNGRALISGSPDRSLDALADACNDAFPL
jgi:hypothetical protein